MKSHNILIYYIGYKTIKDSKFIKINIVNALYLTFNTVNGYFEDTPFFYINSQKFKQSTRKSLIR